MILSATGPVVRVSPREISVADLDTFKEIHRAGGRYLKSDFYRKLVPEDRVALFNTIDSQTHSNRRRLLAGALTDSSVTRLEPIVRGKAQLAVARAGEEMQERGAADVYKWWLFMATDVIGELTFGKSFEMLEAKKVEKMTQQEVNG